MDEFDEIGPCVVMASPGFDLKNKILNIEKL
jgi:hypothetical protein